MLTSVALIGLATFALRRFGSGAWLPWTISAGVLGVCILTGIDFAITQITGEGVNGAVFYHMNTGLKGGDVTQYVWPAVGALILILSMAVVLWQCRHLLRPGAARRRPGMDAAIAMVATAALIFHPVSLASAEYALRFALVSQHAEGFVDPDMDPAGPEKPRNLVILYLESLERTYMDPALFPGLTPNLARLDAQSISFTEMGQTTGAGFTIGGMVATQCGVPLILSGGANSMRVSRFLNGATCLGDILQKAGYTLSYLGGASTEFAGKGAFYRSHGYDEVTGFDELLPGLPDPDYRAEWGIQDDTLFELARARFDRLASEDAPFVLTLLTLDTHHPNGHAETNRACEGLTYGNGSNPMLNSVLCADHMAGQLIEEILAGPHGEDTVVAVMSDHLAMVNSATDLLEAAPRRNLLMLLDSATVKEPKQIDRPATTLDTAPTILSHLGFDVPRMGLGTNLLGPEKTLPESLGVSVDNKRPLDAHVMGFQSVYTRLWAFPDISDGLYVNAERGEVNLGYSAFRTPVLLSFDSDNTVTSATLDDARADETLAEAALNLPKGTRYLWSDHCQALAPDAAAIYRPEQLCALAGSRGGNVRLQAFPGSGFHSAKEVEGILSRTSDTSETTDDSALIERIGMARGDLPRNVPLVGLATGERGVLVQSSAFGTGASFIRRQTSDTLRAGEDWILERGVTLAGITAGGRVEVLDRVDQCNPNFDAAEHSPWDALIQEGASTFVAHVVTVHDTAFCGSSIKDLEATLADLDLPNLRAASMREAYAAVIDRNGIVREFPNREFGRVKIFLEPAEATGMASEPQIAAAPVQAEPLSIAESATCRSPGDFDSQAPEAHLVVGDRLSGRELSGVVGFTQGWWGEEPAGRWSGMLRSTLVVALPQETDELELTLGLAAPDEKTRDLRIEYEGRVLAKARLSGSSDIKIVADDLPRVRPVSLTIAIDGPGLDCPAARSTSSDPRRIGVMLKSIALGASTTKTAPFTSAIAHGGGRLGGASITNSFEAIGTNLSRFEVFEIDFNWTADGKLVCLHDWGESFTARFGIATGEPLAQEDFSRLLAASPERPRNCDLDGLAGWMRANPGVRIVTDVKYRPVEAHAMIAEHHPDLLAQFVPQAYQPEEIDQYRNFGYEDVIWTLYRYGDDATSVVREARNRTPSAITMPVSMADAGLLVAVREATAVPVYIHTVNDPGTVACLLAAGAAGIYSDDVGNTDAAALRDAPQNCPRKDGS